MPYSNYDYETAYENVLYTDDTYSEEYGNNVDAALIEQRISPKSMGLKYATRTCKAGKQMEVNIYPAFHLRKHVPRTGKTGRTRKQQQNLNEKYSKREFVRTVNANFGLNDYMITNTYRDEDLPRTVEEIERDRQNYIARLQYHNRKAGNPPLRYMYVTEYEIVEDGQGAEYAVRPHHHIIFSGYFNRDLAERLWKKGDRPNSKRLVPDDCGLEGLARYMIKKPYGKRRWGGSTNLKKPKSGRPNHSKFSRSKVEKMVRNPDMVRELTEKAYPGYKYNDVQICYNEINAGWYLYVRMRQEDEPPKKKEKRVRKNI